MSSVVYNSCPEDVVKGNINFSIDTFAVLLVTNAYAPNKDAHEKRADVIGEVNGATGYAPGGKEVEITVEKDLLNDCINVALGGAVWPGSYITARGAIYYKKRGGAAASDELITYIDFGREIISSSGAFTLDSSTLRFQN